MYYLRTKPATNAIQFTLDKSALKSKKNIDSDTSTPNANLPLDDAFGSPDGKQNGRDNLRRSLLAEMEASLLEEGDECTMCTS